MRLVDAHVILSANDDGEHGMVYSSTALTAYRDGDVEVLLCAYRAGTAKVGPDGRIRMLESRDGGVTWAPVASPLDVEHAEALAPVGSEFQLAGSHLAASPDGTVVLVAARMRVVGQDSPEFDAQAAGIVGADCVLVRRDADGWGEPVVVDGSRHGDEWAIPCGPPVALGGEQWFAPAERHAKTRDPEWLRGYNAFDLVSADDGRTWSVGGEMMNDPDRELAFYDQHVALLDDGRLVALAWVHDVIADVTLTARAGWSDDGGRTWSAPLDTPVLGGPLAPVHVGGDRVVAAYPHRAAPEGVRLVASPDGGRTWDMASDFVVWDESSRFFAGRPAAAPIPADPPAPLWDTMWGWSFGLPTLAVLREGSLGLAFYCADQQGVPQICFAKVDRPFDGAWTNTGPRLGDEHILSTIYERRDESW